MATIHKKLTAIGNAIREKTGGTKLLTLDDMAVEIAGISTSTNKTLVLNELYPQDISVNEAGTSVTFMIIIEETGNSDEYTCQWYYDGSAVDGANEITYSRIAEAGEHSVYCIVTNKAGSVMSRVATVNAEYLYLYNNGNEYIEITGGWVTDAWNNKGGAKSSPKLYVSSGSAASPAVVGTAKKINFTGFNVLHYTSPSGQDGKPYGGYLRLCTEQYYNSQVASAHITNAGNGTLDISAIDGEYYVCLYALGGGHGEGRCDVSVISLE